MTSDGFVPVTALPATMIELVASIAVYVGTVSGGAALSPVVAPQLPPHDVGPAGLLANPLNWFGAGPPLRRFAVTHLLPQKLT